MRREAHYGWGSPRDLEWTIKGIKELPFKNIWGINLPSLTIHIANAFPNALQVLFPKCHLPITTTNCQQVPSKTPSHPPNNIREFSCWCWCTCRRHDRAWRVKRGFHPWWRGRILRPNQHCLILRGGGNVGAWQSNVRCPSDIAYPIRMTF